jgi:peroxiredoxin
MSQPGKYVRIAVFATQLLFAAGASAQAQHPGITDLVFESRISEAWSEVRKADDATANDIQRSFAEESFAYYQQHPSTRTGSNAAEAAFRMWGNLGATDRIDHALALLPDDFPAWHLILSDVAMAYAKTREADAYFALLSQLEAELPDIKAKAAVLLRLGDLYFGKQQDDDAVARYTKVIALNPDSYFAGKAQRNLNEIEHLAIGDIAQDFSARTLQGNSFALSRLRGQIVLLEFWATWCGPCLPEIPHLQALYARHASDGLAIVGISFDRNADVLREFLDTESMPWIHILDRAGSQGALAEQFNVSGIPRSLLLDRDGRIVAKNLRKDKLEAAVLELMALTSTPSQAPD